MHDTGVLPSRQMGPVVDATWKEVDASVFWALVQPILHRRSGLFRNLKLNRTAGLALDDRRPVSDAAAGGKVIDPEADEVAAAQFAVNGEVEHRQITLAALHLKPDTNGPHFFRAKGTFLANEAAFVPWGARCVVGLDFGGHG
jgi:hypothetical protein